MKIPASRWSAPLLALVALGWVTPLNAHDFWLVPVDFEVAPGTELTILGRTSSEFPASLSAVTVDRIASARLVTAAGEEAIRGRTVAGNSLRLSHRPAAQGRHVVAVTIHPRSVRESAAAFTNYLVVEGAPEALERLKREGRVPTDSVTRRYAKYATSLVTVGRTGASAWARPVGHPLEIVPVSDAAPAAGSTFAVRLLYRGHPMAGAKLHAGVVPLVRPEALDGLAGREKHAEFTTDADGVVRIPIGESGLWNVRTLQIVEADRGSGADWDTHWATLTFAAAPRSTAPRP